MSFDAHANLAYGTVLTAPVPDTSGTSLTLNAGQGALMPTAPFNATVWPAGVLAVQTVAEIVRVTNVAGDVLTITRAQEGTTAKAIAAGYQFAATITAKVITDIEAQVGIVKLSAGAQSTSRSDYTFDNAGGVSFGLNNGVITAAAGTAAPSPVFVSAGTTADSLATMVFGDSNGVSFGLNGSTITATVRTNYLTTARASNDAVGLATAQTNVTWTVNSAGLSLNAAGYAGVGETVGTIAGTDLAMTVNTDGVSIGYAKWLTTAMLSNAATISNIRVSGGTTSNLLSAITFADGSGVSWGLNAGTMTATVKTDYLTTARASTDAIGLNTAKTNVTWTVNSSGLSLDAGGYAGTGFTSTSTNGTDIKATHNTAGLSMAVPAYLTAAGGVQTAISGIIVSDATYTSGSVYFSAQANVTLNSSVNGASQYVRISGVAAQTNQSAIKALGVSNTGNTLGNTGVSSGIDWVIAASGGITASQSTAGGGPNTIWMSVAAPVAQTNQTLGFYAVSNTEGASSSSTFDARTLSFQGKGAASVGFSNGSIIIDAPSAAAGNVTFSAGAASAGLASVVFSDLNGVSFGLNGSTITASVAAAGGGTGNLYATGNTTGDSSSSTQNYSSFLFGFRGALSGGFSNGTMQISGPATSSLVGTSGISLSTNGSTISVMGWTLPAYEPLPYLNALSTTVSQGIGTIYMQPFNLPGNISGGRINRLTAFAGTASVLRDSSANHNSNTTGSRGVTFQYSNVVGLYALDVGTNSTRLTLAWSSMFSLELRQTVSAGSGAGPQMSVSVGGTMSYIKAIDSLGAVTTSSTTTSGSSSSNSSALGTTALSSVLSSLRAVLASSVLLPVPLNTTMTPGQYWFADMYSTASTTSGTSGDALSILNSRYVFSGQTQTNFRNWSSAAASSGSQVYPGQGIFSVVSAALPATMAFSDIRTLAGQPVLYWNYVNSSV